MRKYLALLTLLVITACAVTPKTYDETVWYSYATADVILTGAAAIAKDPATPPDIAAKTKSAMLAVRPYFVQLHDADVAVDAARAALAAGTGTQSQLEIALALLQQAQTAAAKPITAVTDAAGGSK